jgi:hypothetical protein
MKMILKIAFPVDTPEDSLGEGVKVISENFKICYNYLSLSLISLHVYLYSFSLSLEALGFLGILGVSYILKVICVIKL